MLELRIEDLELHTPMKTIQETILIKAKVMVIASEFNVSIRRLNENRIALVFVEKSNDSDVVDLALMFSDLDEARDLLLQVL